MQRCVWGVVVGLLMGLLTACQLDVMFRNGAQATAFRERYVDQPRYTAMVLRPYQQGDTYLVDLSGRMVEEQFGTYRASTVVPLGSPITITRLEDHYLAARIEGYHEEFRVLLATQQGTADEVTKELAVLLTQTPPLSTVRPAMRPYVERQQLARGMSWREVYMSWGQPDKTQVLPSSASVLEEWIYFDRRMHLFLENGYVTNWQQM
jgi:hypothetical protein